MRDERDEARTQAGQAGRELQRALEWTLWAPRPKRTAWAPGTERALERTLWAGGWAGREAENCSTINIHTRRKTTDQHRTADTRRLNRETNEGNEGDTGGATETMIS